MSEHAIISVNDAGKVTLSSLTEWLGKKWNCQDVKRAITKELPEYQATIDRMMERDIEPGYIHVAGATGFWINIGPRKKLPLIIDAWRPHNFHLVPCIKQSDPEVWRINANQIWSTFINAFNRTKLVYADIAYNTIFGNVTKLASFGKTDPAKCAAVAKAIFHEYYEDPFILRMKMDSTIIPGVGSVRTLTTMIFVNDRDFNAIIPVTVNIKLAHTAPENFTDDDLRNIILTCGTDSSDVVCNLTTKPYLIINNESMSFGTWDIAPKITKVMVNRLYEKYLEESTEDDQNDT